MLIKTTDIKPQPISTGIGGEALNGSKQDPVSLVSEPTEIDKEIFVAEIDFTGLVTPHS